VRRCARPSAPSGCASSCNARSSPDDRARNGALAALAARLGLRCVATGNVHAHAAARVPLQDAFVALPPPPHAGVERAAAAPQRLACARLPGGDGGALQRPSAGGRAESAALAEQLDFDLTGDLGYRYPGVEDQTAQRRLAELCGERLHERYAGMALREARARLEQELACDRDALAGRLLPAAPRDPRALARGRGRGPRSRTRRARCCRRAAGAAPRSPRSSAT
jgi:error-prone DNA polymerase